MTSSVDGLISGLSTSSMISQLMQLEAAPQTRLKAKVTAEQSVLTALQSINTKMAAMETAADGVRDISTIWQSAKATSSDAAVTASATAGAATGTLTFDVTKLARNQISTITTAGATPDTPIASGGSISLDVGGTSTVITVGTGSMKDVAAAINAQGVGVKAGLVTNSAGDTVLQLTSTKTGLANSFDITAGLDPLIALNTAATAQDAEIQVGTGAGAYTVSSDSNTFANLMPGVSLNATKVATGVTVSVGNDPDAIAAKMQAFIDATNAAVAELNKQGAITPGAKSQPALAGEYTVRHMSDSIISTVSNGLANFGSFKQIGVETTRDGTLKFDKDAFLAAYAADPATVQKGAAALGDGLKQVSASAQTDITALTQSHNSMIRTLNDQIDDWDVRLATRQESLQRQYSSLEVALGKLKDQSNWLAGQISGLSNGS